MALYRDPYQRIRELAQPTVVDAPVEPEFDDEARRRERLIAQDANRSESGRALRQGRENLIASGIAARGLARQLVLRDDAGARADFEEAQRIQQEAGEFGPQVQEVKDITGVGSAFEYARNLGLQQLPNLALTAATGGVGSLAARGAVGLAGRRMMRTALSEATERAAVSASGRRLAGAALTSSTRKKTADAATATTARVAGMVPRATDAGAAAGAVVAGTGLQAGMAPEIVLDPEGTGTQMDRAGKAAVGALATGSLEALPVVALLRKFGLSGAEEALKGSVLSRVTRQAAKQATTEAATEVAQTFGEKVTHNWVNDSIDVIGPEAYSDYINAAAGGFVAGGIFGAPAGLRGAGRDSDAGRRYTDSFRKWADKIGGPAKPAAPATDPAAPKLRPGDPMGAPVPSKRDPINFGTVRENVETMVRDVTAQVPELASKISTEVQKKVSEADELARRLMGSATRADSAYEILDAPGYQTQDIGGVRVLNPTAQQAGVAPARDLVVAPGVYRKWRGEGVDPGTALVAGMIADNATRRRLLESGALEAAGRALTGYIPDKDADTLLTEFQDALGPEGSKSRNAFNNAAHTAWAARQDLADDDSDIISSPDGAPEADDAGLTGDRTRRLSDEDRGDQTAADGLTYQDQQAMDEERPLFDFREMAQATRNTSLPQLPPTGAAQNTLALTDAKGNKFGLTGRQIGGLIAAARQQDPSFARGGTVQQIASVLSGFAEIGLALDPQSLKKLTLGKGWETTDADLTSLATGAAPAPKRGTPTPHTGARPLNDAPFGGDEAEFQRQRGLTREYAQPERVDTQRDEMADMLGEPPGPRERAPLATRAESSEPAMTPRIRRAQRAQRATDEARARLDDLVASVTGGALPNNETERRAAFAAAMRSELARVNPADLQGRRGNARDGVRAQLQEAAAAYAAAKTEETAATAPRKGEAAREVAAGSEDTTTGRAAPAPKVRIAEGETVDAPPVDRRAADDERRAAREPGLDDLLVAEGEARPTTRNERRRAYRDVRDRLGTLSRQPNQRDARVRLSALKAAAERFAESERVAAVEGLNKARASITKAWQKLTDAQREAIIAALRPQHRSGPGVGRKFALKKREERKQLLNLPALAPLREQLDAFARANGRYYALGLTEGASAAENARRARDWLVATPDTRPVAPLSSETAEARAARETAEDADVVSGLRARGTRTLTARNTMTSNSIGSVLGHLKARLSARTDPDTIDYTAAPGTQEFLDLINLEKRSRWGFYALKQRIGAAKNISTSEKLKLLDVLDERLAVLDANITGSAELERFFRPNYPVDAAHFDAALAALKSVGAHGHVEDALRAVRAQASPAQQRVIDTLLGMRATMNVPFVLEIHADAAPGGGAGLVNTQTHARRETVSKLKVMAATRGDTTSRDLIAILIHEATHAATNVAEARSPKHRRAVEQMLEHAREHATKMGINPDTWYGLADTQEFLAEAFSNPEFQAMLRQMPARNTKLFQSLWAEFREFVRAVLGMSDADASLLDEVFTVGLDMARVTANERNTVRAKFFGEYHKSTMASASAGGAAPSDYVGALSPDNRRFLDALFRRGDVFRQIKAALPASRHEELMSADRGPRLLIDTGLALALNGRLNVDNDTTTLRGAMDQLWDRISTVLQLPRRAVYGRQLLRDLNAPTAPVATRQLVTRRQLRTTDPRNSTLTPAARDITRFINRKVLPSVRAFTQDMNARMRSAGVPALAELATLLDQRTGEQRADRARSYLARYTSERNQRLNAFFKITEGWTDAYKSKMLAALQSTSNTGLSAKELADVARVRAYFGEMRDYMAARGVTLLNTEDYFPIAMSPEKIAESRDDFLRLFSAPNIVEKARERSLKLLREARDRATDPPTKKFITEKIAAMKTATPAEVAEDWYAFASTKRHPVQVGDLTFADGQHDPSFRPQNLRLMDFVLTEGTDAQKRMFATFQDDNMDRIVAQYIGRATRRAEWVDMGLADKIGALMKQAASEGATPRQLGVAKDYVDQIMGAYGADWHPGIARVARRFGVTLPDFDKMTRIQSALMTYQNVRLLPLALASSLIDPLGVSVRSGGEVKKAFSSYRDALRALRDKQGNDALRALAEDLGIIERNAVSEALIYMYGGAQDVTGASARVNAMLFKLNGLEYVTKFSRIAALAMGQRFLIKHAAGGDAQSARYLRELGLEASDVVVVDGKIERSAKIDAALARFVDESVVRPQATQRPGWHNDPHFALAAQYKGYLYSFWNTVMRRGALELAEGNPAVLLPLVMYLPITAVGEMARDMAQGDDDDREWDDYAWLSVERSGLLGPHVGIVHSAKQDLDYRSSVFNSMLGPTVQQTKQVYDAAMGNRSASRTLVEAMPASALYEDWGFDAPVAEAPQ